MRIDETKFRLLPQNGLNLDVREDWKALAPSWCFLEQCMIPNGESMSAAPRMFRISVCGLYVASVSRGLPTLASQQPGRATL